ncbi:carboxynorspermidine decarboxylase [Helicobacter trogontum]|uniref:Carboxynorspermidine/carboxyspermidine decarboxylase n=1 Tax=Helicobacter trogontum TaxID=50960 RepID=A0ABQ0D1R7_9HELI|nr:carboxynorspermidine decarboxylase [Helicobacter trogontum]MCI5787316.1 carboxynorspermidine decarboxylase [Helicobacter trogontum]MDY5186033.1 carboxynorspermidine decarboxylase [Helicobacter trogontum]
MQTQEQATQQENVIPSWHRDFLDNKIMLQQNLKGTNLAFNIPTPSYVLCKDSLNANITLLQNIAEKSRAHILVALKGYSFWRVFEAVRTKLQGATCSGVNETLLAFDSIATPLLQQDVNTKEAIKILLPYIGDIHTSQYNVEDLSNAFYTSIKQTSSIKQDIIQSNVLSQSILNDLDNILKEENNWQELCKIIPYAFFNLFIRKEICVFAPAYKENQMQNILPYATHIIFNSLGQWERFKPLIDAQNNSLKKIYDILLTCKRNKIVCFDIPDEIPQIHVGLRINPLYSEVSPPIYNPCIPKSRLGIIPDVFHGGLERLAEKYGYADTFSFFKAHFSGLHFHTHCEQDSGALQRTLPHVIQHFGDYIAHCKWVNFGGGHHITRSDYDCALLVNLIEDFKARYNNIQVMLEPGEAVGWQTGDLIGEVVDIIENEGMVAILDISASCHMPDCLEMPYRPECYKITKDSQGNAEIEIDKGETEGKYCYRFGGPTCLAGDVIGDYSFNTPLKIGDKIAFIDMIHYTIVKNTTFNGVELPNLGVLEDAKFKLLKQFSYTDFKERN